jgi:hypothetical protein
MKRITALIGAAAFVMMTVGVFAQAKPSFAGKWTREAPAAGAPAAAPGGGGGGRGGGGRGGGFGQDVAITQDATTITLEWMQAGRGGAEGTPQKRVYKLDGTDSVNNVMTRGESAPQTSKAVWEGNKLVITTTTGFGEQKQALLMSGADLHVEQTAAGRDGGPPTTTTIVYKKAP